MDNSMYGWVGKILKIDLTNRNITEIETAKYTDFVGGMGMGMKILWDENPPNVAPLDPENRIVFMTGPLTGTVAPTSGRFEVCTKAAGTFPPMITRSGIGGYWGPELKYAGYDGVIVYGKADKPVYVWINDGKTEIRDAGKLWGMDTYAVQQELRLIHGPEVRTVCIGPAGENLVKISTIQHDTGYSASKIGGGTIGMGFSPGLGTDFVLAWPTGQVAMMGASQSVDMFYAKELAASPNPAVLKQELIKKYEERYNSPFIMSSETTHIDAVIQPRETRQRIIEALKLMKNKKLLRYNHWKKHSNIPL